LHTQLPTLQVSWDDVGGLGDVKQRLQEAVLWPQTHADALERLGATAPKGVLLYGPPGCSKTLLARAVAASSRLNFLSVKGGELYSSYVGESERAVAALFARARAAAPAVVFFDELDGLVSTRGDSGAGAGVGKRVLAQLLTELDGLQVNKVSVPNIELLRQWVCIMTCPHAFATYLVLSDPVHPLSCACCVSVASQPHSSCHSAPCCVVLPSHPPLS
jgi:SpoVK/Ycf46/Vps4 family AAA+-type ATPase